MESDRDDSPPVGGDIREIAIEEEMKRSYLDYAMSVIVRRALPDVRDGLKPVHRRILFSMHEQGYEWNKAHRKAARVVGDVIGKYHPHGDQAVYDALVRMAQDFSMRLPLVDGQGNFGSVDGDPPAAMRYTEVRMARPAQAILQDLDCDTVDFQDNYDNSEREPAVLPARLPNLLVNGASGIAVGMATNIPPHNLGEIVEACIALIDNPSIAIDALMEIVSGPDFPTGGLILGRSGICSAYRTGRGSVMMRARVETQTIRKDREALIVTELPYQVNKATLIAKIAELVRDKKVDGISDIRDESDRHGMRVVIELKRDAMAEVVLNQLYRFSELQASFGCNIVALTGGRPELMTLADLLRAFVAFREEVVTRRTKHFLAKARDRAHILVGLAIAVANIDEVIRLIRVAPDPATARSQLMARDWPARDMVGLVRLIADPRHSIAGNGTCRLSQEQARAILDLRLQRLTALGRDEVGDELTDIGARIGDYLEILASRQRLLAILRQELAEMKAQYGEARRTEIIDADYEVDAEDLIQREDMVVTVSHKGYIKRVALSTYRAQRRGGKGRSGMSTREEDFVSQIFVASTHTPVLFFSSKGMVYRLKVWRLPMAAPQARGKALINLIPLDSDETITTILPMPDDERDRSRLQLMFATRSGTVRRNVLADFVNINRGGKIAMKLASGDELIGVCICRPEEDILLTTANGRCIRFEVGDVRVFVGRNSTGVRGIRLGGDDALGNDRVISMSVLDHVAIRPAEARAYLKLRRAMNEEVDDRSIRNETKDEEEKTPHEEITISESCYAKLSAREQFILSVSQTGYGKRSSAYEYRVTKRGGKGITAMVANQRNGHIVASFPVEDCDQIMLVSDGGQLIRCPVNEIRIVGRATQGVTIFDTADGEHVACVAHLGEGVVDEGDDGDRGEGGSEIGEG
ncbi:MAG: DNA gyrase subunit A [Hyphomicrobiales bacterium]